MGMTTGTMAMFPLGAVLLPGEVIPLQVFEARYRQMVIDLLAADDRVPEFGVTLIERGHEVGGGDQRADVGTAARVVGIDALDDGRYALVALGDRRIRVDSWLPDDPYPRADVSDWPDGDVAAAPLDDAVATARLRVEAIRSLAGELGDLADTSMPELDADRAAATFQLVSLAPVGVADRFRLLAAPDPLVRLELLDAVLDDVEAVLRFRAT